MGGAQWLSGQNIWVDSGSTPKPDNLRCFCFSAFLSLVAGKIKTYDDQKITRQITRSVTAIRTAT